MGRKCVGFVEAVGLAAALQAADTIAKSANVKLLDMSTVDMMDIFLLSSKEMLEQSRQRQKQQSLQFIRYIRTLTRQRL